MPLGGITRPRQRHQWSRLTRVLWAGVLYLIVLYVGLRWGGHHPPENVLPSAD